MPTTDFQIPRKVRQIWCKACKKEIKFLYSHIGFCGQGCPQDQKSESDRPPGTMQLVTYALEEVADYGVPVPAQAEEQPRR